MIVAIELRRMTFMGFVVCDSRAIDQKDIEPAVVIEVESGGTTALGFDNVQFFAAAAEQMEVNASGARDIDEEWFLRTRGFDRRTGRWRFRCGSRM
jgi:hypothetical protein